MYEDNEGNSKEETQGMMVSRADRTPITSKCNYPVHRISYKYDMDCICSEKDLKLHSKMSEK